MDDATWTEPVSSEIPRPWYQMTVGRLIREVFVLGIILGLVTLLGRGVWSAREAARRSQCTSNLKYLSLALHNYHDTFGAFPPAYVADASGKPMHSWRVLILPFMEGQAIYYYSVTFRKS